MFNQRSIILTCELKKSNAQNKQLYYNDYATAALFIFR